MYGILYNAHSNEIVIFCFVFQAHLETVIPALDKPILVVNGAYRGSEAILRKLDEKHYCVTIEIARGPLKGRIVDKVQYEDISKLY